MNKNKIILLMLVLAACIFSGYMYLNDNDMQKDKGYTPKDGFVPDKETAAIIAEAIWLPIYGNIIEGEKPFNVTLKGNVWIVKGTLKASKGGVAYIEIQKSDCRILKVTHGK